MNFCFALPRGPQDFGKPLLSVLREFSGSLEFWKNRIGMQAVKFWGNPAGNHLEPI